ncbi:30S ribosomal protein S6 [Patescibacteria group bacterium]|nr:30S ribosomal protein S6 [Patescibacteria group bacterium]
MNKYEMMAIYQIDMGEEKAKALSKTIQELIISLGGSVVEVDFWGKRRFAYEINHKGEGFYDVIQFELEAKHNSKLKSKLNLTDGLVRYLITAKS